MSYEVVNTCAWHPNKENLISIGADDNEIKIIDINSEEFSIKETSGAIHKIEWC